MSDKLYIYDCDRGQGAVYAPNKDAAEKAARRETGTFDQARNVRLATQSDIEWRKAMGGWV